MFDHVDEFIILFSYLLTVAIFGDALVLYNIEGEGCLTGAATLGKPRPIRTTRQASADSSTR